MRVIGGVAKRVQLTAPKGANTRPTSDRAKEGLFNIVSTRVPGSNFLDLFCGSGAVGIEALSRGASFAAFVDHSPKAIAALKQNLEKTRLGHMAWHLCVKADAAIDKFAKEKSIFDIIFLDPPYGGDLLADTLCRIAVSGVLSAGGIIIAETDTKSVDNIPSSLYLYDTRVYGLGKLMFYEYRRLDEACLSGKF